MQRSGWKNTGPGRRRPNGRGKGRCPREKDGGAKSKRVNDRTSTKGGEGESPHVSAKPPFFVFRFPPPYSSDSGNIFCTCIIHYPSGFNNPKSFGWVVDIVNSENDVGARLERLIQMQN